MIGYRRFRNLELLYTIKAEVSQRRQLRSLDGAYFGSLEVSFRLTIRPGFKAPSRGPGG